MVTVAATNRLREGGRVPCVPAAALSETNGRSFGAEKLTKLLREVPRFVEYFRERAFDCLARIHVLKGPLTAGMPTAADEEAGADVVELPADNYTTIGAAAATTSTGPHLFIRIIIPRRESARRGACCSTVQASSR